KDLSTTAGGTGEEKAAQSSVKLGWFGLFVVLLGRFSTGSSLSASRSHDLNCVDHSVPLCTTSYP
ncbi:MAG: hypothetical protein WBN74_06030, partial [Candidatus Sulfotelmatobacter sp.]